MDGAGAHNTACSSSVADDTALGLTLVALCAYAAPTAAEHRAREEAFEKIRGACVLLWPESSVELYGSVF